MATFAIGDIHGDLAALDDLLVALTPELKHTDTLVLLGDYIDRGPDSRGCVERIIALRREAPCAVVTLMGNHEQWMLKTLHNPCAHSWLLGMEAFATIASYSPGAAEEIRLALATNPMGVILDKHPLPYAAFIAELPKDHVLFFEGLQLFHRSGDVICAHAGIDLEGTLEQDNPDVFLWGTEGFPEGYRGKQDVVYGHWNNAVLGEDGWPKPYIAGNRTFGIDTISYGVLTAMRFPDRKVYQSRRIVSARQI